MIKHGDKIRITNPHSEFHNRIGIAWLKGVNDGWWVKYENHKIHFHSQGVEKVGCSANENKD